jgi:hypothetical protein
MIEVAIADRRPMPMIEMNAKPLATVTDFCQTQPFSKCAPGRDDRTGFFVSRSGKRRRRADHARKRAAVASTIARSRRPARARKIACSFLDKTGKNGKNYPLLALVKNRCLSDKLYSPSVRGGLERRDSISGTLPHRAHTGAWEPRETVGRAQCGGVCVIPGKNIQRIWRGHRNAGTSYASLAITPGAPAEIRCARSE